MRCHICDRPLDTIAIDPRDGKIKPCRGCLEAINTAEYERTLEELEEEHVAELPEGNETTEQLDETGLGAGVSVPVR